MLASLLVGLPAGARSLTPLAVVSAAARRGGLPPDSGAPAWLRSPRAGLAVSVLALGELWGDKLRSAPDRIVPFGLIGRLLTAGVAGAALAPRRRARLGGAMAALVATASAYATFALRRRAMSRFGQTRTGLVEDALALGLSLLALRVA